METTRGASESPSIAELAGSIFVASVLAVGAVVVAFAATTTFLRHTETLEAVEWLAAFAIGVPIALAVARRLLDDPALRALVAPAVPPAIFALGAILWFARRAGHGALSLAWLSLILMLGSVIVASRVRAILLAAARRLTSKPWHRGALVVFGGILGIAAFLPAGTLTFGSFLGSLAILAGALLANAGLVRPLTDRRVRIVVAIAVPLVIALLVWDVSFSSIHDHDFFLGPANDVRHGRYMLVDVYSQYGVLVIYFLAAALHFLSFGYGSLMLLLGVLTSVGTLAIYVVLKTATRSIVLAGAGTFVATMSGPIATVGRVTQYPSIGFLRFGITWLIVAALVLAYRRAQGARAPMAAAYVLVGISSIWSFEVAFYSIGTFVVVVTAVALTHGDVRSALRPLALCAGCVIAAIVLLVIATVVGRDTRPHLGGYIDFIRLYSSGGFGTVPVADWSLGYPMCAGYAVSFIAIGVIILRARGSQLAEPSTLVPLVATTTFGALSFTYFLGRSDPNNLTHISPPFVAMIALWTALAGRSWICGRHVVSGAVVLVVLWSGALLTTLQWSALERKGPDSALAAILSPIDGKPSLRHEIQVLRSNPDSNPKSLVVESLVRSTEPSHAPLLVLVEPAVTTEVLIRLDESNVLPIGAPIQDGLVPRRRDALIAQTAHVPCGTRVVTQTAPMPQEQPPEAGKTLLEGVLDELRRHFTFETVASAPGYTLSVLHCSTR